ncbi:MAG: hypothetical protein ONB16_07025 [candidate division KSB1 bacterium]|nr:hypothetical protein [candidate division KSB1 bacterium]MDZ7340744.1 hypothetical protein [candidate division KSB1 bacterium]
MYAKRNRITIGVLWLLLMAIGGYWYSREIKLIKDLKAKNIELSKQLDGSMEIVQALNAVETQYQTLKMKWEQSPKKIIMADEPTFSLNYINWLVNNFNIPLDFDFELSHVSEDGDITNFAFLFTGEGSYYDLYRFIWLLSENPLLYQVETFNIRLADNSSSLLEFVLRIKGFALKQELDSGYQFSFDNVKPYVERVSFHDAFKPLTGSQRPRPVADMFKREAASVAPQIEEKGLLNIMQCELQALTHDRIYIRDNQGKLVTLRIGDRVRSGSLTSINRKKSEAEFTITSDGGTKTVILGLGYRK